MQQLPNDRIARWSLSRDQRTGATAGMRRMLSRMRAGRAVHAGKHSVYRSRLLPDEYQYRNED